jgi:hypothetical protein
MRGTDELVVSRVRVHPASGSAAQAGHSSAPARQACIEVFDASGVPAAVAAVLENREARKRARAREAAGAGDTKGARDRGLASSSSGGSTSGTSEEDGGRAAVAEGASLRSNDDESSGEDSDGRSSEAGCLALLWRYTPVGLGDTDVSCVHLLQCGARRGGACAASVQLEISNLVTPRTVLQLDLRSRAAHTVWNEQLRGFTPGAYRSATLWVRSPLQPGGQLAPGVVEGVGHGSGASRGHEEAGDDACVLVPVTVACR